MTESYGIDGLWDEQMTWKEFTRLPYADKLHPDDIVPGDLYRISGKSYSLFRAMNAKIKFDV